MTHEYIYTEVNTFNIVFPNSSELAPQTEIPMVDWLRKVRVEGRWWQKVIFIVLAAWWLFLLFGIIDLAIWLTKGILRKLGEAWSVALKSFGAKFLAWLGVGTFLFVAFWAWRSGFWEQLYAWLSDAAQSLD